MRAPSGSAWLPFCMAAMSRFLSAFRGRRESLRAVTSLATFVQYRISMNDTNRTPLFKSLNNEALRAEYRSYRNLAFNNAAMAASGAVNVQRCARQMGRLMRAISIIEGIARQRRISL